MWTSELHNCTLRSVFLFGASVFTFVLYPCSFIIPNEIGLHCQFGSQLAKVARSAASTNDAARNEVRKIPDLLRQNMQSEITCTQWWCN